MAKSRDRFLIGVVVAMYVAIVGFILFAIGSFFFAFRPGPAKTIHVVGTGEAYTIRDTPTLGGDGAKMWGLYTADGRKKLGVASSNEGFSDDDPSTYEFLDPGHYNYLNPRMYYKPMTNELFIATPTNRLY